MSRVERLARSLGVAAPFELLGAGALVVTTPEVPSEQDEIHFKTVVELDGDVITSVAETHVDAIDELALHFDRVQARVRELGSALLRLQVALAGAIGALVSGATLGATALHAGTDPYEIVASLATGVLGAIATRIARLRPLLFRLLFSGIARRVATSALGRVDLDRLQAAAPGGSRIRLY